MLKKLFIKMILILFRQDHLIPVLLKKLDASAYVDDKSRNEATR